MKRNRRLSFRYRYRIFRGGNYVFKTFQKKNKKIYLFAESGGKLENRGYKLIGAREVGE